MSRKGNCWDNAVMESFFRTLSQELLQRQRFTTRDEAEQAIVEYIFCHSAVQNQPLDRQI